METDLEHAIELQHHADQLAEALEDVLSFTDTDGGRFAVEGPRWEEALSSYRRFKAENEGG